MAESGLANAGDGRWLLKGELSFSSVPALLEDSATAMAGSHEILVDLKGVHRADSAGLALLVAWLREAERNGRVISFVNVPEQLLAIARLCGLVEILSFQDG